MIRIGSETMRTNIKLKGITYSLSIIILLLVIGLTVTPLSYANSVFTDVSQSHWLYKPLQNMLNAGIIESSETFNLGTGVTQNDLIEVLRKIDPDKLYAANYDMTKKLTRLETVTFIFQALRLDKLALQIKAPVSPFVDTTTNQSILNLAVKFNFISLNATKTFRPDQLIKKEEAYAMLNQIYMAYSSKLEDLHSYYAISSYSQIEFSDSLNALSFGWSRLEFNKDKTDVILNMTSTGSNEYRVPTGYSSAITATENESLDRNLMVFVKEESVYDTTSKKTVTLAEKILSTGSMRDSVIDSIMNALTLNAYKIPFDGVVIDFEGLKGVANAANLNNFLKQLDVELEKSDLDLLVAVHPQGKTGIEYFDGYDFKTIGNYADKVILMAHDYYPKRLSSTEMASGYTVTPLSPINEIYYALDAITHPETGIEDSKKVMLQLSMDTAQWKVKDNVIINSVPYHPTYQAIAMRIENGATVEYSTNLQSPYISFLDDLDGSKNIVWYEDERSIQAKIDLAKFFKVGGLSVWRLGIIPEFDGEKAEHFEIWSQILKNIK
jgi:spore germination protein YaaH